MKWSISWKVTIDDGQIVKLSKPTGEVSGTASADQKSVPSKCSDEVELPVDAALRQYVPTEFEVVAQTKSSITVRLRGFPVAWAAAPRCTAAEGTVSHVAVTYTPASVAWSKSWGQPEFTIAPFNNFKITPASVGNRFPFAPVGINKKVVFDWSGRLKIAKFGSPPDGPETTPEVVKDFASAQWNALVPLYQEAALALELSLKSEELRQLLEELQIAETLPLLPPDMRKFLMTPSFFYDWFFPAAFDFYTTAFKTLVLLEDAYNDPPLPNYAQVVRVARSGASLQLPSCASAPAGAKSFCARLRRAALAYSNSLQASKSLAQALATTVGRESGAAKAGDKKALARQQRAARALVPRLRVAFANHKAAGVKLAAVLRSGRFAPKLTKAQAKRGIAKVFRDLAAHGVSADDVRSILGGKTLTPVPLDLLALLSGKRPANPPPPPTPAGATITSVTFAGGPKSPVDRRSRKEPRHATGAESARQPVEPAALPGHDPGQRRPQLRHAPVPREHRRELGCRPLPAEHRRARLHRPDRHEVHVERGRLPLRQRLRAVLSEVHAGLGRHGPGRRQRRVEDRARQVQRAVIGRHRTSARIIVVCLAIMCVGIAGASAAPSADDPDWSGRWDAVVTCEIPSCAGQTFRGRLDFVQNGNAITGTSTDADNGDVTPIEGTAAGATATLTYDAGESITGTLRLTMSADETTFSGRLSFTDDEGFTVEMGTSSGTRVRHTVSGDIVISRCSITSCRRSPLAGVTVRATGKITVTTTTDSAGRYAIDLPDGSYVVKPTRPGSTFAPVSEKVDVAGGDVGDVDFATCGAPADASRVVASARVDKPPYCRVIDVKTDDAGLRKYPIALRFRGVSWNPKGSKIEAFWGKEKVAVYPAASGFTGTLLARRWQRRTLSGCGGVLSFRQDGFVRPVTYVVKPGQTVIFADRDPYLKTGDVTCQTDGPLLRATPGLVITSPGQGLGGGILVDIYRPNLGKGIRALVGKRLCVDLFPARRGVVVVSRKGDSIDVRVTRSDPCDEAESR